jgi:hypothetical protein
MGSYCSCIRDSSIPAELKLEKTGSRMPTLQAAAHEEDVMYVILEDQGVRVLGC